MNRDERSLEKMNRLDMVSLLRQITEENDRLRRHCRDVEEANAKLQLTNRELEGERDELKERISAMAAAEAASTVAPVAPASPEPEQAYGAQSELPDQDDAGFMTEEVPAEDEDFAAMETAEEAYAEVPAEEASAEDEDFAAMETTEEAYVEAPAEEEAAEEPTEEAPAEAPAEAVTAEEAPAAVPAEAPAVQPVLAALDPNLPVGSFAEAFTSVYGIVERTQAAADEYMDACRREAERKQADADRLVAEAQQQADELLAHAEAHREEVERMACEAQAHADAIVAEAEAKRAEMERKTRENSERLRAEVLHMADMLASRTSDNNAGEMQ